MVDLSDRLEYWGDTSVYIRKDGEIMPEIFKAMKAIRRYKEQSSGQRKGQWFDKQG